MECVEGNVRSKPLAKLSVRAAIVFVVIGITLAKAASAAEDDYMYCYASDLHEKVKYFSAIFLGDYSEESNRIRLNFKHYLETVGVNVGRKTTGCSFENTYRKAKLELEFDVLRRQRNPYGVWNVVVTNWKPRSYDQPPSSHDNGYSGRESGSDGCYFSECPDGVSPSSDTHSQQSLQRVICSTPEGWCEMLVELPVGQPCDCLDSNGLIVEGITIQEQ